MSWCPLFMQSAYVDRNNNRYGEVRPMISPQDEINKRRSKALHLLTMRQTKAERGAVDDVDLMKQSWPSQMATLRSTQALISRCCKHRIWRLAISS